MVTWESCQSCFSNNCSFKRCLFQLRRWPPVIGPFSSMKRRQVLLSMLFIDARITLRSALVISCVFRVFSSICWFCQHPRQDLHQQCWSNTNTKTNTNINTNINTNTNTITNTNTNTNTNTKITKPTPTPATTWTSKYMGEQLPQASAVLYSYS